MEWKTEWNIRRKVWKCIRKEILNLEESLAEIQLKERKRKTIIGIAGRKKGENWVTKSKIKRMKKKKREEEEKKKTKIKESVAYEILALPKIKKKRTKSSIDLLTEGANKM